MATSSEASDASGRLSATRRMGTFLDVLGHHSREVRFWEISHNRRRLHSSLTPTVTNFPLSPQTRESARRPSFSSATTRISMGTNPSVFKLPVGLATADCWWEGLLSPVIRVCRNSLPPACPVSGTASTGIYLPHPRKGPFPFLALVSTGCTNRLSPSAVQVECKVAARAADINQSHPSGLNRRARGCAVGRGGQV